MKPGLGERCTVNKKDIKKIQEELIGIKIIIREKEEKKINLEKETEEYKRNHLAVKEAYKEEQKKIKKLEEKEEELNSNYRGPKL